MHNCQSPSGKIPGWSHPQPIICMCQVSADFLVFWPLPPFTNVIAPKVRKAADKHEPAALVAGSLNTCWFSEIRFQLLFTSILFFFLECAETLPVAFWVTYWSISWRSVWPEGRSSVQAAWADRAAAFGDHVSETLPSGLLPPGSICLAGVWLHAESSVDRTRSHSQTHGFACVLFSSESVEDAEGLHAFVTPCQDYRDSGPLQGPQSVHGHDGYHIYSARAPPHCLPVALRTGN